MERNPVPTISYVTGFQAGAILGSNHLFLVGTGVPDVCSFFFTGGAALQMQRFVPTFLSIGSWQSFVLRELPGCGRRPSFAPQGIGTDEEDPMCTSSPPHGAQAAHGHRAAHDGCAEDGGDGTTG